MKYEIFWMDPLAAQESVPFSSRQAASLTARIPIRKFQVPLGGHIQEERQILVVCV